MDTEKFVGRCSPDLVSSGEETKNVALTVASEQSDGIQYSGTADVKARRKRLLRKIDLRIMPIMLAMYTLSFLDRSNIGNAKILNEDVGDSLQQSLHITNTQYTDALVIFLVSYCIFGIPSVYMLKKYRPSRWFAFLAFGWGIVTMLQAIVHNFSGLLGIRFILGAFEAGQFPGIVYFLTFWYRPEERAVRIAFIAACATLGGAFGGAIAYGVGFMDGDRGIQAWRWLSIIEGGLTCLVAVVVWLVLPDYPETTKCLSDDEREVAICRSRDDAPHGLEKLSWADTKATLADWRLYLHHILFLCISSPFASFSLFTPTLVSGLGFEGLSAQLFTVPPFAIAFIFVVCVSWAADRYENWSLPNLVCLLCAGVCFTIEGALPDSALTARYVVLCVTTCFSFANNPLLLNYMTANVRGTSAMTLSVPMEITIATAGQVIGLFIYKPNEATRYPTGNFTNAALNYFGAAIMVFLRLLYARRNRHLAPGEKRWCV